MVESPNFSPDVVQNVHTEGETSARNDDEACSNHTAAGKGNSWRKIKLVTYNNRDGRQERLVLAARAMQQMNVDIAILTETKLNAQYTTRYAQGYHIYATSSLDGRKGGVALIWRDTDSCQVESVRGHGPNVISFHVVSGGY
jgi:hypothetical protein